MVNRIAQKGLIDYIVTTMAVNLFPVGRSVGDFWIVFWDATSILLLCLRPFLGSYNTS